MTGRAETFGRTFLIKNSEIRGLGLNPEHAWMARSPRPAIYFN